MPLRLIVGMVLLGVSTIARAAGFEVALSTESAQLSLGFDSSTIGYGGAEISVGGFFNDDDDVMGSLGFMVSGVPAGEQPFSFELGAEFYVAGVDKPDQDFQALALGGGARYHIPANTPMSLGAQLLYAPNITTFGDADDLLDFTVRYQIDLLPSASAFLGYRRLQADLDRDDNYKLDNNVHLGIRLIF
jgi:hypothetical protein